MRAYIKTFQVDEFWRNNGLLLLGSVLAAGLNYLYNPLLGRLLDTVQFGEAQLVVSIFNQVGLLLSAFQLVAVVVAGKQLGKFIKQVAALERLAVIATAILCALTILSSFWLRDLFQFDSVLPFYALGVSFVVASIYTFRVAMLQSSKQFGLLSFVSVLSAVLKIGFTVLLIVIAGQSATAAIVGISAALILSSYYGIHTSAKRHKPIWNKQLLLQKLAKTYIRDFGHLLAWVLLCTAYITILYAGDIIVVKQLFDPESSGLYAGVSAIARMLFFATTSFAWVLIASTGKDTSPHENRQYLLRSLGVVAGISLLGQVIFILAPNLVLTILIGSKFTVYESLLPVAGLLMSLTAVLNVVCSYYIAHRRALPVMQICTTGFVVLIIGLLASGSTIESVLWNFVFAASTSCIAALCWLVYDSKKSRLYGTTTKKQ